jgi:hypothetical protein
MMTKNVFKFLAAALMLLGTSVVAQGQFREDKLPPMPQQLNAPKAPASAPTVTHDYDWYAAKTYTWTDANGASHTASMVDEVTNPYQMYDLLKWVYCDPNIPGNKTTAVTGGNVYYGRQYFKEPYLVIFSHEVEPGWDISDSDVTAPDEDGHTLFLVKLKNYNDQPNNYTYSKDDIIEYFSKYIESIELITDGMRAGTGNNQGTMVNIEGEFNRFFIIGKGKSYYWEPNAFNNLPPLAPFYNMFEEYSPTTTDEGATINDFYESMVDGDVYPIIHDCGSVIYFAHYFSMAGKNSTEEKAMSGMILFIPDNRNAYRERDYDNDHQPTVGMYTIKLDAEAAPAAQEATYDVTLNWTSSLNEVVGSVIPQTYEVYIVTTDEAGNQTQELLTTTTETSYTYQVPQEDHSYTIDYIIHGVATQNAAFEAWSNIDGVIIPGTNDFLYLKLDHAESDYVASEELNYYRNFLTIENEDAINALTPERVEAGENSFTLYRFDFNVPDVLLPVAELELSNAATFNGVNYTITYSYQEALATYGYEPTTAGPLYLNNDGSINLEGILFEDQLTASTANNDHPSRYGYVLIQNNVDNPKSTNTVEVPVLKTGSNINGYYTLEEVMADTEGTLTTGIKNAELEMNLANNPAIYYYTIERGNNTFPSEAISKLQRRIDGSFMEMNNALGLAGNIYESGPYSILDELVITGTMGDYMSYLPVIWTFGGSRVGDSNENSYGSAISKTGVGEVRLVVDGVKTTGDGGQWKDENGKLCCIYYPTITATAMLPEDASVRYEPFMYRVWRVCDEIRGYYFGEDGKPVNDLSVDRNPHKLIAEEMTDEYNIELGGVYSEFGFGARINTDIQFVARLYYKVVDPAKADGDYLYYVVEQIVPWNNIPTGIIEINAASEVSKTYVNAQGQKSEKPFSGVNIVITRYSDGSTTTTKVIR